MTEPLSFRQIRFPPPELLSQFFLLGDIQGVADQAGDHSIFKHRVTCAAHRLLTVLRMLNAILNVSLHAFRKHFPDQRMDAIAVGRTVNIKPFLQGRNTLCRIEAEDRERFWRPVIEYAIGPERPAPHMSQSFPLTEVEFASLDIDQWALRPLGPTVLTVIFQFPRPFSLGGLKL